MTYHNKPALPAAHCAAQSGHSRCTVPQYVPRSTLAYKCGEWRANGAPVTCDYCLLMSWHSNLSWWGSRTTSPLTHWRPSSVIQRIIHCLLMIWHPTYNLWESRTISSQLGWLPRIRECLRTPHANVFKFRMHTHSEESVSEFALLTSAMMIRHEAYSRNAGPKQRGNAGCLKDNSLPVYNSAAQFPAEVLVVVVGCSTWSTACSEAEIEAF